MMLHGTDLNDVRTSALMSFPTPGRLGIRDQEPIGIAPLAPNLGTLATRRDIPLLESPPVLGA